MTRARTNEHKLGSFAEVEVKAKRRRLLGDKVCVLGEASPVELGEAWQKYKLKQSIVGRA